jgi:uncharacterized membrane protein YhdT
MEDFNDYGDTDSVRWSMATLLGIGSMTLLVLLMSDVTKDLASTGITLQVHSWSSVLFLWRFICLSTGVAAIVYMFRMKSGHMIVRSHEKKADVLIHPLRFQKFVTFSSWTLILNVIYFALATITSYLLFVESDIPQWLNQFLAGSFVTALGASFLTSTVVRFVILPRNHADAEHHKRQFWFHNQVMHNFCTIFLVVEIMITTPQLEFSYMLFGILIGLAYALFAFPFAVYGGGYYCYSFIDPRLQKAPLFISMLALAISLSYVGVWLVSQFITLNYILGIIVLCAWSSSITQFQPRS